MHDDDDDDDDNNEEAMEMVFEGREEVFSIFLNPVEVISYLCLGGSLFCFVSLALNPQFWDDCCCCGWS